MQASLAVARPNSARHRQVSSSFFPFTPMSPTAQQLRGYYIRRKKKEGRRRKEEPVFIIPMADMICSMALNSLSLYILYKTSHIVGGSLFPSWTCQKRWGGRKTLGTKLSDKKLQMYTLNIRYFWKIPFFYHSSSYINWYHFFFFFFIDIL